MYAWCAWHVDKPVTHQFIPPVPVLLEHLHPELGPPLHPICYSIMNIYRVRPYGFLCIGRGVQLRMALGKTVVIVSVLEFEL